MGILAAGLSRTEVAQKLGLGRSSVYRIVTEKGLKAQRTYARVKASCPLPPGVFRSNVCEAIGAKNAVRIAVGN